MDRYDQIDRYLKKHSVEADLAQTPEYVIENEVKDFTQLAMHGVKLGGRASEIPLDKIKETTKSNWPFTSFVHCTDKTTYKVIAGIVVEFFLPGSLFAKCGLGTKDEVVERIGKPDRIRETKNGFVLLLTHMIYKKKHLVFDITADGEVARVNVSGK